MFMTRRNWLLSAGLALAWAASAKAAPRTTRRRLAVLIAMPDGEAERNDQRLITQKLLDCGYRQEDIVTHCGPANREALLRFLASIADRIGSWSSGDVFLHYTGSGWHQGAAVGLEMGQQHVTWNEVFNALHLPSGVHLVVLPDCCYTNLLDGRLPPRLSALVMLAPPGVATCQAGYYTARTASGSVRYGRITYFAVQAMTEGQTIGDWARRINDHIRTAVNAGQLRPSEAPILVASGDR